MPEDLVNWRPVAQLLGLKKDAFWQTVHAQDIPRIVINQRVVRFRMSDVEDWLKKRTVGNIKP